MLLGGVDDAGAVGVMARQAGLWPHLVRFGVNNSDTWLLHMIDCCSCTKRETRLCGLRERLALG
jgi:hypothetical protein